MSRGVAFGILVGLQVVLGAAWLVFLLWRAGRSGKVDRSPGDWVALRLQFAFGFILIVGLSMWLAVTLNLIG